VQVVVDAFLRDYHWISSAPLELALPLRELRCKRFLTATVAIESLAPSITTSSLP
jgi:hypothetical protein